ncbi:hypothetical protein GCM10025876_02020 [Demequina litorisediminis]|uniref:Thiamine pyrophosphate enzyme TPP-binding domain-containing protein n=1 Tax=Demequina litorisediminis TaxID=1849022 RepID=A0ABQ6I845_9MICO|nr:hypothetical protein GCM10025876_02020 [Demequina litorisediminis]
MGLTGIRVEDPADLEAAVVRMLATEGPVVLDVVTAREELSLPPAIEAAQARGFALWALRTVMSGRGDEPTRPRRHQCVAPAHEPQGPQALAHLSHVRLPWHSTAAAARSS